jgi:uncharacterized lipoprotein YbaY/uncharacterized membrane protein
MRRPGVFLLALSLLMPAACQLTPALTADRPGSAGIEGLATIVGSAYYLEKILPPPDSKLRVQLIDSLLADTRSAVLARQTYSGLSGPPFGFELAYDPARIRESGMYGLHAGLYGADGELLFVTDTRVPVTPGRRERVEFRMVRVAVPATEGTSTAGSELRWQCGEVTLSAEFTGEEAQLRLPGARYPMIRQRSASGAKYADDAGNGFWMKGDEAVLSLAGQETRDCARSDRISPWQDARDRGVALRASGNEPGWHVEVGHGEHPAMRAVLDYGQRRLEVARARPLPLTGDLVGFSGNAADGTALELRIRDEPCRDGMSGHPFPHSAELRVDAQAYRGCAAFLQD